MIVLAAVSAAVIGAVVAIVLSAFLTGGPTGILSTSGLRADPTAPGGRL
jgi:hypothetical protein